MLPEDDTTLAPFGSISCACKFEYVCECIHRFKFTIIYAHSKKYQIVEKLQRKQLLPTSSHTSQKQPFVSFSVLFSDGYFPNSKQYFEPLYHKIESIDSLVLNVKIQFIFARLNFPFYSKFLWF